MAAPERRRHQEPGRPGSRFDHDDHHSLRERVAEARWRRRIAARRSLDHGYRIGVGIVGGLVVVAGLATIPLPGPG